MVNRNSKGYPETISQAARPFRAKLESILERNRANVMDVINRVETEIPTDQIIKSSALEFKPSSVSGVALTTPDASLTIHPHALQQVIGRANINMGIDYARALTEAGEWGKELLAESLNRVYHHSNGKRNLVRSVSEEVRGFLGGNFRRLDAAPLAIAFCESVQSLGAVIADGVSLDTKVRLRAYLPYIFEPVPNEFMLIGLQWNNSDYGDGPHGASLFALRMACTNLAIGEVVLRQIHIGKRLDDNITYSQATYEADTKANVLALHDTVRYALGPAQVESYLGTIKDAYESPVAGDPVEVLKKKLNKTEAATVAAYYNSPDVENLPPGKTVARLANAITWFAQSDGVSAGRALELQEVAGAMIPKAGLKPVEVKYE